MGKKTRRTEFGNLVSLKRSSTTTIDQSDNNEDDDEIIADGSTTNNTTHCTKIMRITPDTFEKLKNHSHTYHKQPISYDEIIDELCSFYDEKHKQKNF